MGDILLLRHAQAVDESLIIRESHRYLTADGRRDAVRVAELLHAQGLAIARIVSSPLMRAVQTAELVAAALRFAGPVESMPALAPGGDAHHVAGELASAAAAGVLAIGHEPALSGIGALLCPDARFRPLHRGEVALVRDGHTIWTIGPTDAAPVPAGDPPVPAG